MSNVVYVISGNGDAVIETVLIVMAVIGVAFTVYVWYRILRDR